MAEYRGVSNVARKVAKEYRSAEGVARKVIKAYRGVDNVARLYFNNSDFVFDFLNANISVGTNDYYHGFEDGVLKLYLNTTHITTLQDNRPTVTASLSNGDDLGGRTLEFTYKRTPWKENCDDFVLYFLDASKKVINWNVDLGEYPTTDFAYMFATTYTTKSVTIPDGTRYINFSMNSGISGTNEETGWINHLTIDDIDII